VLRQKPPVDRVSEAHPFYFKIREGLAATLSEMFGFIISTATL
jgi:hypothetical protein